MFCGVSVLSGDFVGRVSHGKLFLGEEPDKDKWMTTKLPSLLN